MIVYGTNNLREAPHPCFKIKPFVHIVTALHKAIEGDEGLLSQDICN